MVRLWNPAAGTEVAVLRGHTEGVNSVAFAPDGKTLASGGFDKVVRLWGVAKQKEIAQLSGDGFAITAVSFNGEGTILAVGSHSGAVRLWDVKNRKVKKTLKQPFWVHSLAFAPDGKTLAVAAGSLLSHSKLFDLQLWDVATGKVRADLKGHTGVVGSVAFSADSSRVASASFDETARLWDAGTGKEIAVLKGHDRGVLAVAFAPDGRSVATGSQDRTVCLWDVGGHNPMRATLRGHAGEVYRAAICPDGKIVAWLGRSTARLVDLQTRREIAVLRGDDQSNVPLFFSHFGPLAFSPDSKLLATCQLAVRVWDVAGRKERAVLRVQNSAESVAFSPDSKFLAVGYRFGGLDLDVPGELKLWDIKGAKELASLSGLKGTVYSLAFSHNGKLIAAGTYDRNGGAELVLYDVAQKKVKRRLTGLEGWRACIAFSPDDRTLVAGSGSYDRKLVWRWDVETGRALPPLKGHRASVQGIAFSPDGKLLATASHDKTVKLWAADTGKELASLPGHQGGLYTVAFTPDGKVLVAAGGGGTVERWNVPVALTRGRR
jgi:WD40 repeat protein